MHKSLFWLIAMAISTILVTCIGWQVLVACGLMSLATLHFSTRALAAGRVGSAQEDSRFTPTTSFARF
ncbi:hypothetical protein WKW80_25490 [Variovorax humicola]|uniref:Uncharacterized protein n=1 Tax=Variovorax humicola TaxID=1769758 RepID=A0ABU8W5R7_9BURK